MSDKDMKGKLFSDITDIAAKATLGILPGGGFLSAGYEMLQLLGQTVSDQIEMRNERRYQEFIDNVFEGNIDPAVTEYLTVDDYQALLNGCISDIETEKAGLYGALTRSLGLGKVRKEYKRFLIVALSQLSYEQMDVLRRAFIAMHNELKPEQGAGRVEQDKFLLGAKHGLVGQINYEALAARMMAKESKLTQLGEELVRACYCEDALTPSAIGAEVWVEGVMDIQYADKVSSKFTSSLIDAAWISSIKTTNRAVVAQGTMMIRPAKLLAHVIVVFDMPENILQNCEAIMKQVGLRDHVLVVFLGETVSDISALFPDATIIASEGRLESEMVQIVVETVKRLNRAA